MVATRIVSALTPAASLSKRSPAPPDASLSSSSVSASAPAPTPPTSCSGALPSHASAAAASVAGSGGVNINGDGDDGNGNGNGDDYWASAKNYAASSYNFLTNEAMSQLTSLVSSFYNGGAAAGGSSDFTGRGGSDAISSAKNSDGGERGQGGQGQLITPSADSTLPSSSSTFSKKTPTTVSELRWLLKNPYNSVMGRHEHENPSSLAAVRSLLTLVPINEKDGTAYTHEGSQHGFIGRGRNSSAVRFLDQIGQPSLDRIPSGHSSNDDDDNDTASQQQQQQRLAMSGSMTSNGSGDGIGAGGTGRHISSQHKGTTIRQVSDAETASRLAEGTIRALRDLALDEAIELHSALRFWTERWERPLLSWLEAGPRVWLSKKDGKYGGYNHQDIGRRVSQIQAVLARRCASIGQLQEHLLRAGWQRGVEKWGVLPEWTMVGGGDGAIAPAPENDYDQAMNNCDGSGDGVDRQKTSGSIPSRKNCDVANGGNNVSYSLLPTMDEMGSMGILAPRSVLPTGHGDGSNSRRSRSSGYYGDEAGTVFVRHTRGGRIVYNDPALAAWTVDAIRVVRDQLYKAGNGEQELPYYENWAEEVNHFHCRGEGSGANNDPVSTPLIVLNTPDEMTLPLWATEDVLSSAPPAPQLKLDTDCDEEEPTSREAVHTEGQVGTESPNPVTTDPEEGQAEEDAATLNPAFGRDQGERARRTPDFNDDHRGDVVISDLPLFAAEVSSLLDAMERAMKNQRKRRLERLKPPSRIVRNWYAAAVAVPLVGYVGYRLLFKSNGALTQLWRYAVDQVRAFYAEHISGPMKSIYGELFKGRPDVTDRKARLESIETLKSMLGSWLDETFPKMSAEEKRRHMETMDMSLVERKKEDAIKSVLEINNIVRLSMIEMQFIKKELMNAIVSMDELMGSNEINMQIAAMTPVFIVLYGIRQGVSWVLHSLLKMRKSREETYASFRHILLDIERLLIMRDNPPSAPPPLGLIGRQRSVPQKQSASVQNESEGNGMNVLPSNNSVLNSNDLGMLMLLVHECRTILWNDSRRFSRDVLRNVSEDLAELAGERGPVSVQQQLAIIARMVRTYSFLKVVSTGLQFELMRTT